MKKIKIKNSYDFFVISLEIVLFLMLFFVAKNTYAEETYPFSFTGEYQEFIAPKDAVYKIQLWGAQGGNYDGTLLGGLGAYTEGYIRLRKDTSLYVYVGGQPSSDRNNLYGGWNGGGNVPAGKDKDGRAGGGATDIRTVPTNSKTEWNLENSLLSRIMVASGGGGAAYESSATWRSNGGDAGGLYGFAPSSMGGDAAKNHGLGADQTTGGYAINNIGSNVGKGVFGKGGQGISTDGGSGGGGGWFGGGGSYVCSGGGGGSSFISGHNGCIAVNQDTSSVYGFANNSYSWTGYNFYDTKIIDGKGYSYSNKLDDLIKQPTSNNLDKQIGNSGNGFARITYIRDLSSDASLKELNFDKGSLSKNFDKDTLEYDLILNKEDREVNIEGASNENNIIIGNGRYEVRYNEEKSVNIVVTNELGETKIYTINIKRKHLSGEHSSKLADLYFDDKYNNAYTLSPKFESETLNYNTDLSYNLLNLKINAIPYDDEATVKIENNEFMFDNVGTIKITVTAPNSLDTIYQINYKKGNKPEEKYEYSYTGNYETFTAPTTGKYKIELWGSQGASGKRSGGLGAYTKGDINLKQGDNLYIYVGNSNGKAVSFNGGGAGNQDGYGGGGATDIRLISGDWNDFDSLKSRIMIASGGGGAENWHLASFGGAAGGLHAYDSPYVYNGGGDNLTLATGASQNTGGAGFHGIRSTTLGGASGGFGNGGAGDFLYTKTNGGGGGSGYYGGGGGGNSLYATSGGAGGSSYISGHPGCDSIKEESTSSNIIHSGSNIHYSNRLFTNTEMIDGLGFKWTNENSHPLYSQNLANGTHVVLDSSVYTGQPDPSTGKIVEGHTGNGFARITSYSNSSENNYIKELNTSDGTLTPAFSPATYEYDLILPKEIKKVDIEGILYDEAATIVGNGEYEVKYNEEKKIDLVVTSESGDIRIYTLNLKREHLKENEHSSKLAELELSEELSKIYSLFPEFDGNILSYNISLGYSLLNLDLIPTPYDDEATVKIENNNLMLDNEGTIKITVSEPNSSDTVYQIHYTKGIKPEPKYEYNYTGDYQTFIAPTTGKYKIELWGSQGASTGKAGGLGAYTCGDILLSEGETIYIYVGNSNGAAASFNGGGGVGSYGKAGGGGATDVRLTSGAWNDFDSLKSRIMVASGGGGGDTWSGQCPGGAAGGLYAYDTPYYSNGTWHYNLGTGGDQTTGGNGTNGRYVCGQNGGFGFGGQGGYTGNKSWGGGAGSGYYGGGGGGDGGPMTSAGSGGSSYISGHPGCNSISKDSSKDNITHTGSNIHYSNKKFTNTVMIDGLGFKWEDENSTPNVGSQPNGRNMTIPIDQFTGQPDAQTGEIVTGHTGNGFARITPLDNSNSKNNYIKEINVSVGSLSPVFSPTVEEYDLVLDKEIREVDIEAVLFDSTASIDGNGTYKIKYNEEKQVKLEVTSESGDVRVYTINLRRKKMPENEHSSLIADLDFIVAEGDPEPELYPTFDSNVFEYVVDLTPNMIYLDVDTVLYDDEATITKTGTGMILSDEGEIILTVTEPNSSDTVYKIKYKKEEKPQTNYEYNYTGDYQTFIAPLNGKYRFELWGSQGANGTKQGGLGAYTKGDLYLKKGETLYIYVGNANNKSASFNGGGAGTPYGFGGGGATDVRLTSGDWNNFDSLKSRIMVAAGGGGSENWAGASFGGAAGGIYSYDIPYYSNGSWSYQLNTGASQIAGGIGMNGRNARGGDGGFGVAGSGGVTGNKGYGGGGGSGYFGGSGGGDGGPMTSSGSGGSSYISGHPGCNSIKEESSLGNIIHTESNTHYSNKVFTNTEMVDGLGFKWTDENSNPIYNNRNGSGEHGVLDPANYTGQPDSITGDITEGHIGNGFARITPLFDSKNNYLESLESNYGTFDKGFNPFETEYTLTLDKYEQHFTLSGKTADKNATVTGLEKYEMRLGETKLINITVTAPNGDVRTYHIKATRGDLLENEHSTKLVSLNINNNKFKLNPEFISVENNYTLEVPNTTMYLDVSAIPYDKEANIKIEGNGYLETGENIVTVTVTHEGIDDTVYKVKVTREEEIEGFKEEFSCINGYQKFVSPASTYYKIALWGARGGYGRTDWALRYRGGLGAYTEGEIYLAKGEEIYVYVGCQGEDGGNTLSHLGGKGGYNGGANGGDDANRDSAPEPGGGGGGATDVRLTAGDSNDFASLKSRIMVASGGGGGSYYGMGGAGGTLEGLNGAGVNTLPNQTSGYKFGIGKPGITANIGSGGGAGGYFGGNTLSNYSGSGASSFVSGCEGCKAISKDATENNITMSEVNKHYSNYVFDKIKMYSGEESMPNKDGGYQVGNNDDGYAIITSSTPRSENNFLKSLSVDGKEISPNFEKFVLEYTLNVDPDDTKVNISAEVDDEKAILIGDGEVNIPAGTTDLSIFVTAENGDIRVYTIKVTRNPSSNSNPLNIKINGLVPNLCNAKDTYCKQNPDFDKDQNEYNMVIPNKIKELSFEVEKANIYQTITGDGIVSLEQGENEIVIEVTSEDGTNKSKYTYHIERDKAGDNLIKELNIINPLTDINFLSETADYYFSVPEGTNALEMEIVLSDENASYEVKGNENLKLGMNIITIDVTAQNGDIRTYTLNVYKEQSGNTYLTDIKVSSSGTDYKLSPDYNKIITNYIVNVPNEVDNVDITYIKEEASSVVSGAGNVSLNTGTNKFPITVTASDGSVGIYELYIVRAKSSDATLKKLDILEASLNPEFKSDEFNYNLTVNSGVTSLSINTETTNAKAVYKISGNSGFTIGINKVVILVTAEDGTKNTYTLNVTKEASNNNYLSTLIIDKYDMTSIFNKETEEYNIIFNQKIPTIKISATAEDSTAKVSKTGVYSIRSGMNQIKINVTAENGNVRTYTLNIMQEGSTNNNLLSLVTSADKDLSPTFASDKTKYNLEVENSMDEITVLGVPEEKTSTVIGNGTYHLNTGDNTITITVSSESGEEKDYVITVTRKKSSNANASLIIAKESVLNPHFDKDTLNYNLKVLEDVTKLSLEVELEDETSTYDVVGNSEFVIGNNTVNVIVTAEDGTKKTYTLDVLRQAKGEASDKLESLSVSEGVLSPSFDKDITYYEVEVENNITNITLEGKLEDENASVTGLGEYELKLGKNVLGVEVTSAEGKVRSYQVVVNRKRSDEARLASLVVSDSTLSPNFDKDTFEYNLETSYDSLNIKAIPLYSKATFKITGNENLDIGNNDVKITVTAEDGKTTKEYILHVKKVMSNNNNLKSLSIDGYEITPEFSSSTTIYNASVPHDVNNVIINAKADDESASVAGDGPVDLNMGNNYIDVIVTSETGNKKIYTLIINREASSNNYLSSLMVSSGSLDPSFEKEVNNYTINVPYEDEDIVITGLPEDLNAKVLGLQKYNLKVGNNPINITVTAEDGTSNVYTLDVVRNNIISSKLESLSVDNYKLAEEFNPDLLDYNLTIDYEVETLNLNIETMDKNATYEVKGNEKLIVGMNTIEIVVTDSLGNDKTTYTLNVNKNNYSNNFLNYIYPSIGDLTPDFEKYTLSYTVNVPNETEGIDIFAEPEVDSTTVTGKGHYNLNVGDNLVTIEATSSQGIKRIYYLNIIRAKSMDNSLTNLIIKEDSKIVALTPLFNKDTLEYNATVSVGTDSVDILATAEDKALLSGIGNKKIKAGNNLVEVSVTSEAGIVKIYKINVMRPLSSDNTLLNIIPSAGTLSPSFSPLNDTYSLNLDASSSMLSFNVTTNDKNALVTGIESMIIPDGSSTREIIVTAEDGTKKTYTINVYKDKMDEARLESLSIKGFNFNETFDKDTYNYTITLPNDKETILASDVEAISLDSRATIVKTSILNLSTKNINIYSVIVTAKDGFTKKTYTIEITREKSGDSTLSNLEFNVGVLSPEFVSGTTEYNLTLNKEVTKILKTDCIATPSEEDATVTIPDDFEFTTENNTYEIIVTSPDGKNTTTYIVHLKAKESNINILDTLTTDKGVLSPEFNPYKNEYTLHLDENAEKLNINATADPTATIVGTGEKDVPSGETTYEIVVTAEDGTVNTYKIIVSKDKSTNNNITSIIPSRGSLSPSYSNNHDSYIIEVDEDVDSLDLEVTLEKKQAILSSTRGENSLTVTDTSDLVKNINISNLEYGDNNIVLTVTSENGDIRTVNINIIRNKLINNIEIEENILLDVGDILELNPIITPEDATDKELEIESQDNTIVEVNNNTITGINYGLTTVTVKAKKNPSVVKTINVKVTKLKISSSIYDVRKPDGELPYVIGAELGDKLSTFISNLENDKDLIHIYDMDDNEILDLENEIVKTGLLIKLEYETKVYDSVFMAVRGDNNGDGKINVLDYNIGVNHTLKKSLLEDYWFDVTNVDKENIKSINVIDTNMIRNKILKKIQSLNIKKDN